MIPSGRDRDGFRKEESLGNVDLKFYLSIFLRRLPYFIVIAAFLSAVGIAVASILPPLYSSTAKILVEAPQIPGDLARTTVPIDPVEQIQIIEQRLMTRANILSLADKLEGLRRPARHPGRRDHRRHAGPHRARADHPGPRGPAARRSSRSPSPRRTRSRRRR